MQISKLLKELNITFGQLQNYQEYLDVVISDSNQEIDEDTYLKVIALYNSQEIQNEIATKEQNKQILAYDGYVAADGNKFLAKIKWYYNKAKDGEYGFAEHDKLKSIYFRGDDVKGIDPHRLYEGQTVIVHINKKGLSDLSRVKANSLHRIDYETDVEYLTHLAIFNEDNNISEQALRVISKINHQVKPLEKKEIESIFKRYFTTKNISYSVVKNVLLIAEKFKINLNSKQNYEINNKFSSAEKVQLFKQTNYQPIISEILDELVTSVLKNLSGNNSFINKIQEEDKQLLFKKISSRIDELESQSNLNAVIQLLKEYDVSFDYNRLSNEQNLQLWLANIIDFFPVNAVYQYLIKLQNQRNTVVEDEDDFILSKNIKDDITNKLYKVFNKLNAEESTNLFYKAHYNTGEIKAKDELERVLFFIDNTKDEELKASFIKTTLAKSSDFIKLKLFLENYTNELAYHNAVIYTGVLSSTDQKLFFKKVLMLIETKALDLTLNDLNKITSYTYTENEWSKEIDGTGLDFTLSVILKLVTDLSNNVITQRGTIFEIIANQIKTPKDLLVIDGFFQACTGRTKTEEYVNDEGDITYVKKTTDYKPRFAHYCDGRKAINRATGESVLSNDSGLEFWWCENRPCYEVCRTNTSSKNWQNYTLQDVLRILNISYQESQYEILLSVVNRVNRFLEHLKCKSCGNILRPNGKSNYGFHRTSMFSCTNKECEKPDVDVYLSHCLNGKCEDVIDSRTSVKCKPSSLENPDNCGWYICNNCFACCSNEKLAARKNTLESFGQEYKCHTKGHKDLGIICCTKCGSETKKVVANIEMYQKQLDWFIQNKESDAILKSGQRDDGKWWFRWHKGNLTDENFRNALRSLRNNGFQVPNYNTHNDIQFIAEPFEENNSIPNKFNCPKCKQNINLEDQNAFNSPRVAAVKSFHEMIFSPESKK